jgi:hypothetical protein
MGVVGVDAVQLHREVAREAGQAHVPAGQAHVPGWTRKTRRGAQIMTRSLKSSASCESSRARI